MKKRILSALLVLTMVFSMLPIISLAADVAYNPNSGSNVTITVTDQNGNRISNATVKVTRSGYNYTVYNAGNGQYLFTRNSVSLFSTYSISVSAPDHTTESISVRGNSSSASVNLTYSGAEIITARIFYIANGIVPDSYAGAGDAVNYGPSANNTPLVEIDINITKLRELALQDNAPVIYRENTSAGNQWEFIPAGNRSDADYMDHVRAFWDAIISCTEEDSITAFELTGLFDHFEGYCLKKQGDSTIHCDGVLSATPPVYVVELYEQHEGTDNAPVYFGGGLSDSTMEDFEFLSPDDILLQYNTHLGLNITWVEDDLGNPLFENDQFTGHYIKDGYCHTIYIKQFDTANAKEHINGIYYIRQSDTYYLAKFNMHISKGEPVSYVVTYTDGAANEVVFTDHEYPAKWGEIVPAYTGVTIRKGYNFQGWYLEGTNTDKVYSDAEIANMTVTGDMTFHAVWAPVPKFVGTVMLVLNGTYDSTSGQLIDGTLIDPGTVLGISEPVSLSLSADGINHIPLNSTQTGIYSATLENGTYHAYYTTDGGATYTQLSTQPLIIENADRTRYLFYNSVTYDPNGGTLDNTTALRTDYYHNGYAVTVYNVPPVRDGYIFLGWEVNDTTLQPGDTLTSAINEGYLLTANWVKTQNIYVSFTINHKVHKADGRRQLPFTIDMRPAGSSADYTEIYANRLVPGTWENDQTIITDAQGNPIYQGTIWEDGSYNYTGYTPLVPTLSGMRSDMEYTVTSHKTDYTVERITQTVDENGDLRIHVELTHTPEKFELTYHVTLDEDAKQLDPALWPKAVNVKVSKWDSQNKQWLPIVHHTNTYERVALDANGEGSGSYSVWQHEDQDADIHYFHRIEIVSYELQDGTIVSASDPDYPDIQYVSENKRFFAEVTVTDGGNPENTTVLTGAYWDGAAQQGQILATVSIPVYTVTLEPNGGILNGSDAAKVLEDQIITPDISVYVPTRDGSYVFDGWYLVEDGVMTDRTVSANDPLTSDITLRAKWKDPVTVDGLVTVAGTYELTENDVTTLHTILDHDRIPVILVVLQKATPSGYYETVQQQLVTLDYSLEEYYFQGTRAVGVGFYRFPDLPDDGQYRISILSANYTSTYQNEDESVLPETMLLYNTYNHTDYVALPGENDPATLTVNAHLHFSPPSFDLEYQVNAGQLGIDFRPDSAQILITCRDDPSEYHPSLWGVITQMMQNGVPVGNVTALDGYGKGSGTQSVWKSSYDGQTLYDYGLRLQSTTKDGVTTPYTGDLPYTVLYQAPAYFDDTTGAQNQLLVATLVPNTYAVTYHTNGGTIYGTHVTSHKWSYETELTEVIPIRLGYEFGGWYLDENFTTPLTATSIPGDVAEDVHFYAKWTAVQVHMTVVIDNSAAYGGIASNFEKYLTAQLTRKEADVPGNFLPVEGQLLSYGGNVWHTGGNGVETDILELIHVFSGLSTAYDYNANVTLDGYRTVDSHTYTYVDENGQTQTETLYTGVEKEQTVEDGAIVLHHEITVCLKYDPDLMDLQFSVEMAQDVDTAQYPAFAQVKVTAWYDHPENEDGFDWYVISQHTDSVVQVPIHPETGNGTGSAQYPVWQWLSEEYKVPYHYRMEVVSLSFGDGTILDLTEQTPETVYAGSGYSATVYAENGCQIPIDVDTDGNQTPADTAFPGAYGTQDDTAYMQKGTLRAVIDAGALVFHTNNADALDEDVFRTYYPAGAPVPGGTIQSLNADGTVPENLRYDIPEFAYLTHNRYVFDGWYTAPDETGTAINWNTLALTGTDKVHVYAHWIETGTVQQAQDDDKQLPDSWLGTYQGYDLVGIQLRQAIRDSVAHYGDPGSGVRFVAVLSQELYRRINALPGNEGGAEYGFIMAREDAVPDGTEALQYNGKNVNGQDTRTSYVINLKCSGVPDHYTNVDDAGNGYYRLYTGVVTYGSAAAKGEEALAKAYAMNMVTRAYIRYYDANGLFRTYYNNYSGTAVFGGCSASYNMALEMLQLQ